MQDSCGRWPFALRLRNRILVGSVRAATARAAASRKRCTLPVAVFGNDVDEADRARILLRRRPRPSRGPAGASRIAAVPVSFGASTMKAFTIWPRALSGMPTTAQSATEGCDFSAASTSGAAMLSPDETIMSSARATKRKRPVLVLQENVAGQVPAVAHEIALARIGEVAAAGRAAHREPAELARRQLLHVLVDDPRLVAGHRPARRRRRRHRRRGWR